MLLEARWITSTSASALHAARWMLQGVTPVDPKLAGQHVAAEVTGLGRDLETVGLQPAQFFAHAVPLAARYNAPDQVADVALAKILGPRQSATEARLLARRLHSLWTAVHEANPPGLDELELRSRPLREQWEARGGGLLTVVGRLTQTELIVTRADVILLQPVLGGGGDAHPLYNSLSVEAVLANPTGGLPEIARLGWLWAQLNLDLPKYHDHAGRSPLVQAGALAVLPPLLAAAHEVELVTNDPALLETALRVWRAPPVDVDKLLAWWDTYRATNPSWAVALAALEQMLCDA